MSVYSSMWFYLKKCSMLHVAVFWITLNCFGILNRKHLTQRKDFVIFSNDSTTALSVTRCSTGVYRKPHLGMILSILLKLHQIQAALPHIST